jgi:hypothetical protein
MVLFANQPKQRSSIAMRRPPRQKGQTRDARRDGRPAAAERRCSPSVKEHITRLVVEVGNRAGEWRDAAVDAELAFLWWKNAAPAARPYAATVYMAAIEREEQAANEYRRASEACCTTVPQERVSAKWSPPGRKQPRWRLTYDTQ